ncbi:MAG: hypothetical protein KC910_19145 [Candidatus Eremiobacteraeota bacterium]|nr:hypothetical protein [Candidatus Eremiobacteraeota bacterium]
MLERLCEGGGLIGGRFDQVVSRLEGLKMGERSRLRLSQQTIPVQEWLAHLTHPATRWAVIAQGAYCLALTNLRAGSDFADQAFLTARGLGLPVVRYVDAPARRWRQAGLSGFTTYESRMLEFYTSEGVMQRSICCSNDGGRWVFRSSGEAFPEEAGFPYGEPSKSHRFGSQHLAALLEARGYARPRAPAVTQFVLVEEELKDPDWRQRVEAAACTPQERDNPAFGFYLRAMSFMPHLASHARSVIEDLEKALLLDPSLEAKVKEPLARARRAL